MRKRSLPSIGRGFADLTGMAVENVRARGLHRRTHRPSAEQPVCRAAARLPTIVLSRSRPSAASPRLRKRNRWRDSWIMPAKRRPPRAWLCSRTARADGSPCAVTIPWSFLHNLSKSSQMKSVMRWLSRDRLPAYVASFHKANVWVRPAADGSLCVAVVNSSFDPAKELTVALRTDCEQDPRVRHARPREHGHRKPIGRPLSPLHAADDRAVVDAAAGGCTVT